MNKKEITNAIRIEKKLYFPTRKHFIKGFLLRDRTYRIWKYQHYLRLLEYNSDKKFILGKLKYCYYSFKINSIGARLGIEAWHSVFDEGLFIHHSGGGIVVNSDSRIGKNCHIHGGCCVGNDGRRGGGSPKIGDNCDIGFGAMVIGNITLGDNIKIGAGAVVVNDFKEDGAVLVGIPAKNIKK